MMKRVVATSALVLLSSWSLTAVYREVPEVTPRRAVDPLTVLGAVPAAPAIGVRASAVAQDPAVGEAALGLDRPARRLIQQGLRQEGFDPGAPDGLFGPRTRAAIRAWQASRGAPPTGYLTGSEAELLRAVTTSGTPTSVNGGAAAPPPDVSRPTEDPTERSAVGPLGATATSGAASAEHDVTAPSEPPIAPEAVTPGAAAVDRPASEVAAHSAALVVEATSSPIPADVVRDAVDDASERAAASAEATGAAPPDATGPTVGAGAQAVAASEPAELPLALDAPTPVAESIVGRAPAPERCDEWNTREFFEWATAPDVSACLAAGAAPEARDDASGTPLHWAAAVSTDPDVIGVLLAAGAAPEVRDDNGITPLYEARRRPAVLAPLVEALVAAGTDGTVRDDRGVTHLHYVAAGHADPAATEALLAAGAEVGMQDLSNETPLHYAARSNENPAVVELLLAAGADVAVQDDSNATPLHYAARSNANPAVAELLLAAGADVAARDTSDRTPLHYAAPSNANPAIVELLLAAGADVAARAHHEKTPLHYAAQSNENPAVVELLLAAGSDVAARNDGLSEWTPLHYAVQSNANPAVAELLLAAGADVAARDTSDRTPLHYAAQSNRIPVAVALALLAGGADPDARDRFGRSPLHEADPAKVAALVAAGANVDARDEHGATPLHHAVWAWVWLDAPDDAPTSSQGVHVRIAALIAAGANIEARDQHGSTPLHRAAAHVAPRGFPPERFVQHAGHTIEALLDGGASATARNAAGQTPWDLAQANDVLRGTDGYWHLNDARFNAPRQETGRPATVRQQSPQSAQRRGPGCEIPGYPNPVNPAGLGLSWCGPAIGLQRRVFALQAAGAWCAIAEGTSSTPDEVSARHQEINYACDAIDALGALGQGPPCACPSGYRP